MGKENENVQKILITCLPELENTVADEVRALGFKVTDVRSKAVSTQGTLEDTYKLNLWLRSASNVMYRIAAFKCLHPDQLYKTAIKMPWGAFMQTNSFFTINSFVRNNFIKDNRFANLKLKDAIADHFSRKYNKRPDSGSEKHGVSLYLHWIKDNAAIYLDTTGIPLTRRGYRLETGPAPLNEALAASIILSTTWDKKSTFINPMCGTGTLAIEAAMMAANIAPGLLRKNYSFFHLRDFNRDLWHELFNDARKSVNRDIGKIIATDKSRRMIQTSRNNAKVAGVEDLIEFSPGDFARTEIPQENKGIIVFNPEYGERLGDLTQLEDTYARIGDFFKQKCAGYNGYIFTGNMDLAKKIGLRSDKRITFFNAKIECRLLEFSIYEGSKE